MDTRFEVHPFSEEVRKVRIHRSEKRKEDGGVFSKCKLQTEADRK